MNSQNDTVVAPSSPQRSESELSHSYHLHHLSRRLHSAHHHSRPIMQRKTFSLRSDQHQLQHQHPQPQPQPPQSTTNPSFQTQRHQYQQMPRFAASNQRNTHSLPAIPTMFKLQEQEQEQELEDDQTILSSPPTRPPSHANSLLTPSSMVIASAASRLFIPCTPSSELRNKSQSQSQPQLEPLADYNSSSADTTGSSSSISESCESEIDNDYDNDHDTYYENEKISNTRHCMISSSAPQLSSDVTPSSFIENIDDASRHRSCWTHGIYKCERCDLSLVKQKANTHFSNARRQYQYQQQQDDQPRIMIPGGGNRGFRYHQKWNQLAKSDPIVIPTRPSTPPYSSAELQACHRRIRNRMVAQKEKKCIWKMDVSINGVLPASSPSTCSSSDSE